MTPKDAPETSPAPAVDERRLDDVQRVLVLQGGGALGSYQGGVYEALAAERIEPHWVAGISIGAINAALIAGNAPDRRVERLRAFWEQVSSGPFFSPDYAFDALRSFANQMAAASVATVGVPGFFTPRMPPAPMWPPGAREAISYYDTAPLRETLERLVDFDRLNSGETRLSVGAVNVQTGGSTVFDNTRQRIGPEHIMASGALPPGFPPEWIEGEAYWDGGLVSNTPLQFVLDAEQDRDLLIFQVDLFNAHGPMPANLLDVDERARDIRHSSRTRLNTDATLQIQKIKAALRRLIERLPQGVAPQEDLELLREAATQNAVTVAQLIYRKQPYEGGSKDFEFSRQTMLEHWASGHADVEGLMAHHRAALLRRPATGVKIIDAGRLDEREPTSLFS